MTTLQEFIDQNEITAEVVGIDERSDGGDLWDGGARHFRVTLHRNAPPVTVALAEIEFSQGSAFTADPTAHDTLGAITQDVASLADYEPGEGETWSGFERWAEDYGYDTDSRRAERSFNGIKKQRADLLEWLGAFLFDQLILQVNWADE